MALTTRSNESRIVASWFNDIKTEIESAITTVSAKTGNYTLTSTDRLVTFDCTSGNLTATLPALSGNTGKNYFIKKIDSSTNTLTIDGDGSETIDGATTVTIRSRYDVYYVTAGASEWHITGINLGAMTINSSGHAVIDPTTKDTYLNSTTDTSANDIEQFFGDQTGGATGIRSTNGTMQFQSAGGGWTDLGAASGLSYVPVADGNGDIDTNWSTYADAAGTSPVDGEGGSPTITFATSASGPLRGSNSFLFTKDAANRQGEGAVYEWADLATADLSRSLRISFEASTSQNYADGDIRVYIISSSDNFSADFNVIETVPVELLAGAGVYTSYFQTDSSDTDYRLCFHCASTSASAYTVKIDQVEVSPTEKNFGQPITNPTSYTPTYSHAIVGSQTINYWQVGKYLHVQGIVNFNAAGVAGALFTISYPSGLSADTSVVDTTANRSTLGYCMWYDNGTGFKEVSLCYDTANTFCFVNSSNGAILDDEFANGDIISFNFRVPIAGWGVTAQLADVNSVRPVIAKYTASGSDSMTDTVAERVYYDTKVEDTHAAVSATNFAGQDWTFTAPYSMGYRVTAKHALQNTSSFSGTEQYRLSIYGNGVEVARDLRYPNSNNVAKSTETSTNVNLLAGQTIYVEVTQNSGGDLPQNGTAAMNQISIESINGNQQAMAGEDHIARASGNPASATAGNPVIFPTVDFDTHGSYNNSTGLYTCDSTGKWKVYGYVTSGNATITLNIAKNGSTDVPGGITDGNGEGSFYGVVSANKGQTLALEPSGTLDVASGYIAFEKM
jgi:hypothetical protein